MESSSVIHCARLIVAAVPPSRPTTGPCTLRSTRMSLNAVGPMAMRSGRISKGVQVPMNR